MKVLCSRFFPKILFLLTITALTACGGGGGSNDEGNGTSGDDVSVDVEPGDNTDDDMSSAESPVFNEQDLEAEIPLFSCVPGTADTDGCWRSPECTRLANEDGDFVDFWLATVVQFEQTGDMNYAGFLYNNSACLGNIQGSRQSAFEYQYQLTGEKRVDSSGIETDSIKLIVSLPDGEPVTTFESYYFITLSNTFCLSENLQLKDGILKFDPTLSANINFSNCLNRSN